MFQLVADTRLSDIGSLYWEKLQAYAPCHILRKSVNGASTMCSFASWVIYVPIGWRHPLIRYWQPFLAKTTATCSLPHPENEHQGSVNSVRCCILGTEGIAQIFAFIIAVLTAQLGKNTIYQQ